MIARYTRPEMGAIWEEENKYRIWTEIEILACEAQAELGVIPRQAAQNIRSKAKFDVAKIEEIEMVTKHDIIAFLTNLEEYIGEDSRFVHLGMTSSDVLDTCLAVQMKQAGEIILTNLNKLKDVLAIKANQYKYLPCIGRSHGIHAEAMTFGMKFALWYDECKRNIDRLNYALLNSCQGAISGAIGTYEHIDPWVEEFVCEKLGIKAANISTQVVQRDNHAQYLSVIALIGAMLEKIAIELRHLQRTEVREAEEYFSAGQKGSSAMPHKRNPISAENISGQARLLRSNLIAALENNALWHERDISHSSVERIIFPDSTISCDYILNRSINLVDKLVVYPDNIKKNLDLTLGLIHSQKVLLELAKKGMQRQAAYVIVQKAAMKTWDLKTPLQETLWEQEEIQANFKKDEIDNIFNYEGIYRKVDYIYNRLGL